MILRTWKPKMKLMKGFPLFLNLKNITHVHVQLKATIGDYNKKYPDYEQILSTATNFLKAAKKRLKIVKNELGEDDEKTVFPSVEETERIEMVQIDREVLDMKIKQLNDSIDINHANDVSELDEYIIKMEAFVNGYFDMSGRFKYCFGKKYDEYAQNFDLKIKELSEEIKLAKMLRKTTRRN